MEDIVCLETKAFYALINDVVERVLENHKQESKWVSAEEAMEILKISSKTTLQKLKNEGYIRYSQPMKKLVVYDRKSILDYLEKHAKDTFR